MSAWGRALSSPLLRAALHPAFLSDTALATRTRRTRRLLRRWWRHAATRVIVLALVVTLGSAAAMFLVEHASNELYQSPWDSLWWSLVTMTTTGYGDIVPKSFAGRALGVITMVSGMGLVSVLTALIASAFVTESLKEARGLEAIRSRGHIIIAGWNLQGEQVIEGLGALYGADRLSVVLINQLPEETVNELFYRFRELDVRFVRGDPAVETVLERANLQGAGAALLLADASAGTAARADERTILTCLAMKQLHPELKLTGELLDAANASHLQRAGADDVVVSGEFNPFLLSAAATSPGLPQAVRALLTFNQPTRLSKMALPPRLQGQSFGVVARQLREERGALAIGVVSQSRALTLADVLSAESTSVDEFIRRKFEEAGLGLGGMILEGVKVNPPDDYVLAPEDSLIIIGAER